MGNRLLDPGVVGKLNGLRRGLRGRLAIEGLSWIAVALVAVVFVTLAFDYTLRLERTARGLIMALSLAAAAWIAYRRLVGPMLVPMGPADLGLLVETRFAQLGERLISTIQFAGRGAAGLAGQSQAMIAQVARQANELAGLLDFRQVIERRRGRRIALIALAAGGLLAGFCVWQSDVMRLWLERNVAFGETPWPQDIYLKVAGGPDFAVLRGEDLVVTAVAERSSPASPLPAKIVLHAHYPSEGWTRRPIDLSDSHNGTYAWKFRSIAEDIAFYVTGGDDKLDGLRPHKVQVIDPPALTRVRFVVKYPDYRNSVPPEEAFSGARGGLTVPVGSRIALEADATKDVQLGQVSLASKGNIYVEKMTIRELDVAGGRMRPRRLTAAFDVPARLPTGEASRSGARYALRLIIKDTDGYTNGRGAAYRIEVRPDAAPQIQLYSEKVRRKITARAVIPLRVKVKDKAGIRRVWSQVRVETGNAGWLSKPVKAWPDEEIPPKEFDGLHELDIQPLGIKPDGEQFISVRVQAADNMPAERFGGPNVGASAKVLSFAVVPDDVVTDWLLQRQRLIREQLAAAKQEQAKAHAAAIAAGKMLGEAGDRAKAGEFLASSAAGQTTVSAECARCADQLGQVLDEMKCNRLGTLKAYNALESGVIVPLAALAGESAAVQGELNAAVKQQDPAAARGRAEAIAGRQEKILRRMDEILDRMTQALSIQEAINRATLIRKALVEVRDKTRAYLDRQVGGIFEPETTPGAGTRPASEAPER